MRILIRNRLGEEDYRQVHVGTMLVGLRLTEVTFESREEILKIMEDPQAKKWVVTNLIPAMLRKP